MRCAVRIIPNVLVAALICGLNAMAADFEVGVAVRDITPEPGINMWGYSDRAGPATGTLDPLMARAVVFRVGETAAGIVTLDLGRVLLPDHLDRIRERVAATGIDHVFFTASHTHGAPAVDVDAPYTHTMEELIGDALEEAAGRLRTARIAVGRTRVDLAHNRRKIMDEGTTMMVWRNAEREPLPGPVDHEVSVIKITDTEDEPLAVLVNYACHPVVLGPDNLEYTADFVGMMTKVIKEETGAEALFLQGASGDVNPYLDKTPIKEGGIEAMHVVGKVLGYQVVSILPGLHAEPPKTPSIDYSTRRVTIGTRWNMEDESNRAVLRGVYGALFDKYLAQLHSEFSVPISTIVLNKNLALAGMPGELFTQFQLDLKTHSPVRDTFLVGYTDEFHVYFPTVKDSAARGYGAALNTYVGLGAGNRLITESVIEIGRLVGLLNDNPAAEDFRLIEQEPSPQ